jgi:hypothetical protein
MKNILILILFILIVDTCADKEASGAKNPTEKRLRIAVVDTGISTRQIKEKYMCKDMSYFSISTSGRDWSGHGSNVVGLIGEKINTDKYCITIYSFNKNTLLRETNYYLSVMIKHRVVGVNLSIAASGYDKKEEESLRRLTDKNVKVFIASGNNRLNLDIVCNVYPACHKKSNKKLQVIGSTDKRYSNYGKIVDRYIDGTDKGKPVLSGTSMSTAIATGLHFSK